MAGASYYSDSASTSGGTTAWSVWVADTASTTSATSSSANVVWRSWGDVTVETGRIHPETPEMVAAREKARQVAEEKAQREAEERMRAEEKALELMMLSLTPRQRDTWNEHGWFEVVSQSGKVFRIRNKMSLNVDEYDVQNEQVVASHCIVPKDGNIPLPDMYVMQMLMLQYDEAQFMRVANHRQLVS